MPLSGPQAFSLVLALAAVSCTPGDGPPTITGRTLVFVNNTDDEICEATVETLDGFVEAALLELGVDPPDEPFITYRWEDEDGMEQSPCPVHNGTITNCAPRDDARASTIYARSPYHLHELAHAIHHYALPDSMAVLQEGFAEFLNDRGTGYFYLPFLVDDWEEELGLPPAELDYGIAQALVYETIRRYGFDGFVDLWQELPAESSGADLIDAYQELFGEDAGDVLLSIQGEETPHLMLSCVAPTASETLAPPFEVRVPEGCEPETAGLDSGSAIRTQRVRIESLGTYQLTRSDGDSGGATLYPCELGESTGSASVLHLTGSSDSTEAELVQGTYVLETRYNAANSELGPASITFGLAE